MNSLGITPFFAIIDDLVRRWNQMPPTRHNLVLALVVLGFLTLGVAIWALFFHTPSSRKSGRKDKRSQSEKRRRKWRKRRREHRPLNPTLAQTGGLPPARDPDAGPRLEAGP